MCADRSMPGHTSSSSLDDLVGTLRLVWSLLRDGQVPGWVKTIPLLAFVYLLSPIDLLPGLLLPGVGVMDDLAVILLSLKLLVDLSPPALVEYYRQQLSGRRTPKDPDDDFIDATYRVLDESHRP